jgi:transposase
VPSMPQPTHPNQDHTDQVVLGVETHKDIHIAVVITILGTPPAGRAFPTTTAGYRQMLTPAPGFDTLQRAGLECSGSPGAALTRHLQAAAVKGREVN